MDKRHVNIIIHEGHRTGTGINHLLCRDRDRDHFAAIERVIASNHKLTRRQTTDVEIAGVVAVRCRESFSFVIAIGLQEVTGAREHARGIDFFP